MSWVLDLDGVVWLAHEPIPGASDAVARLDATGADVVFVTNFSALTRGDAEDRLAAVGIDAVGRVITSAMAAASLVAPDETVLVCAGDGVREAVTDRGARVLDASIGPEEAQGVDVVIVGYHRHFDYLRMSTAARALHHGARLVATNMDPTYPTPDGLLPGNGSLVAAVATAGRADPVVAGKPHRPVADLVHAHLGTSAGESGHIVVGDLPATDGQLAATLGFPFGLVLSGVTDADAASQLDPQPAHIAADLASLVDELLG